MDKTFLLYEVLKLLHCSIKETVLEKTLQYVAISYEVFPYFSLIL